MLRSDNPISPADAAVLPETWRADVNACLVEGEKIVAQLEIDLDAALQFHQGIIVLTNRRLLAKQGDAEWQSSDLRAGLVLTYRDHAGIGALALCDASRLLGQWHYTLNHGGALRRLMERFHEHVAAVAESRAVAAPPQVVCPICETVIPDGTGKCPDCAGRKQEVPSVRTLFRLGRFARPYRGSLVLGLVLTLLATGAALVPPYLIMPLTDDVLIPFQNGVPIDVMKVVLLLSGLLAAALLAWILDWAKTYILAIVSESIGSDLRNTTFAHLQGCRWSISVASGRETSWRGFLREQTGCAFSCRPTCWISSRIC